MDNLEVHHVTATVHGRYLLRASSDNEPAPLLVGFHGYGENAERLFEAMLEIPGIVGWNVVVAQALHPFYNTRSGEVVASWMTRLDRELAIADNLTYVTRLLADARDRLAVAGPSVFLGFSQGTAMAYRAAVAPNSSCDAVIALAGDVPPELEPGSAGRMRVLIGRGRSDQWYDEAKMETDLARLRSLGSDVETCIFDGGHEWTPEFRAACREFLKAARS
jgi:predicted esterase